MSVPSGGLASIYEELGGASNVLLLAPSMDVREDEGCVRLLSVDPTEGEDVLCVTLTQSPDDRLAAWRSHFEGKPAEVGFVDVGDPTRSASSAGSVDLPGRYSRIETVSSPADLTGLGMKISRFLTDWHGDGNQLVVCFHSLTTLLQYVDLKRAFRFLHVLTGRLKTVDAVAHYHMDPSATDQRTLNTLKPLFDAVVELDGDDGWVVRSR